ncbi:hypothetical protein AAVH_27198 [Aphelenchoides avenae]|nr:hypothetical protein AAVH_27198 [Aphelenchus avenae]
MSPAERADERPKCQEYAYEANVLLIVLELDGFSEQIDWAFHGNRLNADEVDHWDNERFPQYRFYFHGPNGARVLLDWCTAINGLVLQTVKGDENFQNFEWDQL